MPYFAKVQNTTTDLIIGNTFESLYDSKFKGKIDDLQIYNRSLSEEEIFAKLSPTVPNSPQSLIAEASQGQVKLNWDIPVKDGGEAITNYNIYRVIESDGNFTLIDSCADLDYIDTAVTNGRTYSYIITAVNSVGENDPSNEVSATPKFLPAPPAPGSAPGFTQIFVLLGLLTATKISNELKIRKKIKEN